MEPNLTAAFKPGRTADLPTSVLVVEDEWLISDWVARALSEQGFAVETVTNAADALLRLAREPFDVLFTDINLGRGMDGVTLARRARAMRPAIMVVYASARPSLARDDCVPGAIVISKPYDPELVGRLLTTALGPVAASTLA